MIGLAISCSGALAACNEKVLTGISATAEERIACASELTSGAATSKSTSTDALYLVLQGIGNASFTRPTDRGLAAARSAFEELDRRHAQRPADRREWQTILLLNGLPQEAAAEQSAHPTHGAPAFPVLERDTATSTSLGIARFWRWDSDRNVLREQAVDLGHGLHLVVDASPSCHFCPLAAAAIQKDAELGRLFRDALWISRPEEQLDSDYYHRWNGAHPAEQMVVVIDVRGWDVPAQWVTPQFRFFQNGKVVATVLGWSDKTTAQLLAKGAELGALSD